MKISFSPVLGGAEYDITVEGDTIWLDGVELDFSPMPEGAWLPNSAIDCDNVIGDVIRKDGHIEITVRLWHGSNAPYERRFPEPILVTEPGSVELPPYDIIPVEEPYIEPELPTDEDTGTAPGGAGDSGAEAPLDGDSGEFAGDPVVGIP
jgi:hypothetical protein